MAQEAPAVAAPKKSRKLLFIIVAVVVLLGGGGGAYWMFAGKSAGDAEPVAAKPEAPAIVNLEPFVVNLADPGGSRYLRVTLGIVVEGENHVKELAEDDVTRLRLRSSILEMLAEQTADQLTTVEGKAGLKKAIAERAMHGAEHLKVSDVLFSEFIVQ
jgi:flagellar protein FliL